MADIFLSYKRTDRDRVTPIVALLQSCGWSVWWDGRLDAGERWDEVIEREIGSASCVVAVWSEGSVSSRWVRAEANEGLERGILVPVFIDATRPPLGFKLLQSIDLVGWRGDAGDPAAKALVCAAGRLLGHAPLAVNRDSKLPQTPDDKRLQEEQEHWQSIRKSRDPRLFSDFLATYPDGRYARAAGARLQQLALRRADARRDVRTALASFAAGILAAVAAIRCRFDRYRIDRVAIGAISVVATAMAATLWLSGWFAPQEAKPVQQQQLAPCALLPAEAMAAYRSIGLGSIRFDSGNIAPARGYFHHADHVGLAAGALWIGKTYDRHELVRVRAVMPHDHQEARKWYEKALKLASCQGDPQVVLLATELLARLTRFETD